MLTVKCAEGLRLQSGKPDEWSRPGEVSAIIRLALKPLLPHEAKESGSGTVVSSIVISKISELCKMAANLALMLRRSKSTYECKVFKIGDAIDESDDSDMVPQDFVGQR